MPNCMTTCALVVIGLAVESCVPPASLAAKEGRQDGVTVTRNDNERRVDVSIGGNPFTSYIYPTSLKKPVLFPLRSAKGTVVTRGFPLQPRPGERADHPRQVGAWCPYGDVNGIDFWGCSSG